MRVWQPWSADVDSTFSQLAPALYGYMQGASEFVVTGSLKNYDITPRLGELRMPVLFTGGEFDEASPTTTRWYASLIPGTRAEIIPGSGHLTMHDNPDAYVRVVRTFLDSLDRAAR